jgi:hypothetical protein
VSMPKRIGCRPRNYRCEDLMGREISWFVEFIA